MLDVIHQNFEYKAIEADIERLAKEIAEKKNLPEHKSLSDRELIKQALHPIIQQAVVQSQVAASQPSAIQSDILPDYLQDSPSDIKIQVEELIGLTLRQGVEKAVKTAVKSNAFVLDAFHDALTDKLHEELKKRGII